MTIMKKYIPLILLSVIWFLGKFFRYAFPPLFETIQISYDISTTFIGVSYTLLLLVYALLQFPSGLLADRYNSLYLIIIGAGIAAFGAILLSFDFPIIFFVIAILLIGIGTGLHKIVAVDHISNIYPSHTGRFLGIFDTFGTYGGVGASIVVTLFLVAPEPLDRMITLLPGEQWRGVFLISGVFGIVSAMALSAYSIKTQAKAQQQLDSKIEHPEFAEYLNQFTNHRFALFALVAVLFGFSYNGAIAFLPLFLSSEAGLSTTAANLLYSSVFAASFVQVFSGDLSDRFGRLPVISCSLLFSGTGLLLILLFSSTNYLLIGLVVIMFAIGSHGFRPVRGIYIIELLPNNVAAGGLGTVRTLLMGAGALSPSIIGFIADQSNFSVAFLLLTVIMISAVIISLFLLLLNLAYQRQCNQPD